MVRGRRGRRACGRGRQGVWRGGGEGRGGARSAGGTATATATARVCAQARLPLRLTCTRAPRQSTLCCSRSGQPCRRGLSSRGEKATASARAQRQNESSTRKKNGKVAEKFFCEPSPPRNFSPNSAKRSLPTAVDAKSGQFPPKPARPCGAPSAIVIFILNGLGGDSCGSGRCSIGSGGSRGGGRHGRINANAASVQPQPPQHSTGRLPAVCPSLRWSVSQCV